ncbi:hypothetical protein EJB05_13502, partial [Eragrostis curvula]
MTPGWTILPLKTLPCPSATADAAAASASPASPILPATARPGGVRARAALTSRRSALSSSRAFLGSRRRVALLHCRCRCREPPRSNARERAVPRPSHASGTDSIQTLAAAELGQDKGG